MTTTDPILCEKIDNGGEGRSTECAESASMEEHSEPQEHTTKQIRQMSVYDIRRKQELDYFMGRGLKPLDGTCLDRRSNGVLDD